MAAFGIENVALGTQGMSLAEKANHKILEEEEVLLRVNTQRFVLFPIMHKKIWEMYKKHEASFWTAEEIDLSQDQKDWDKLNENEQHFIKHVLAFFAAR